MESALEQAQAAHTGFDQQRLDALVAQVFVIEEITLGKSQQGYIVRYGGRLRSEDSIASYDRLASLLTPYNVTPLFTKEQDRQYITLVPGKAEPKASNPVVNLVLFILTIISVLFVSSLNALTENPPGSISDAIRILILEGGPFTISFLGILAAHEFGHYLMGRHHGVHVTLPYFIPLPFTIFGTMGAFINMKDRPKNRRQLLDIGLAGPFAGLVVAIPVLILGLSLSVVEPLPLRIPNGMALQMEGNSLLYLLLKYVVFGQVLPAPASFEGLPEWAYWLRYFFTGRPFPLGGLDVMLHPVALAGWGGILITALNLIPAGQLDGGHVLYTLFGRKTAQRILPFILVAMAFLGVFFSGWWLWLLIIFFLGRAYAEPLDQITELDDRRRWLAVAALVIFFLIFTPVPLNIIY